MSATANTDWLTEIFDSITYAPVAVSRPVQPIAKKTACHRCGGTGRLPNFSHIKGGECFRCHGTGGAQ